MRIPSEVIDEVRAASDIVAVVGAHVALRQRGKNYTGLCPFHTEKTPSFTVNQERGLYKCFGCGKGGNVFQFLMEVEALTFVESVRKLGVQAGITVPASAADQRMAGERQMYIGALQFAESFFRSQLAASAEGQRYLKGRGLKPETLKVYGVGYAPLSWDALQKAGARRKITTATLQKAGLIGKREGKSGYYDRFRGRIMFPITTPTGQVIGFGGRVVKSDNKAPKYINSPETKVYSKSHVLFGLHQAKAAIQRESSALMVEGYTDVLALHQAGVKNAIAPCGTALTEHQVRLLKRYAKQVILLFDADTAGAQAALRSVGIVLAGGMSVHAVTLPAGHDPDSFITEHGTDAFQTYQRAKLKDFVEFMSSAAVPHGQEGTPEGEAEVMRSVVAALRRIPDPLLRTTYERRARSLLGIPEHVMRNLLEPETHKPEVKIVQLPAVVNLEPEEGMLLRLMTDGGGPVIKYISIYMSLEEFREGPQRRLAAVLFGMREDSPEKVRSSIVESEDAQMRQLAVDLQMDRYSLSPGWKSRNVSVRGMNDNPQKVAEEVMLNLKKKRNRNRITWLAERLLNLSDNQRVASLQEIRELEQERAKLLRGKLTERGQ